MEADRVFAGYKEILSATAVDAKDVGTDHAIPQFPQSCIANLCADVKQTLMKRATLIRVTGTWVIVGDLHGNFHDLIRIFRMFGLPPQTNYIFLGDYVDRGEFSVEVISLLFVLYVKYPESVVLLRGNHEFIDVCSNYGFKNEIEAQFGDDTLFHNFIETFNCLPLAAILNESVFFVHGGISPHLINVNQIQNISRPLASDNEGLIKDLLWSDPSTTYAMYGSSDRGGMTTYGYMAVNSFLERNDLKMIVRAHQCVDNGAQIMFNKKLCTVFSTSSYKSDGSNEAAVLKISPTAFSCQRFDAKPRVRRDTVSFFTMKMQTSRSFRLISMSPVHGAMPGSLPGGLRQSGSFLNRRFTRQGSMVNCLVTCLHVKTASTCGLPKQLNTFADAECDDLIDESAMDVNKLLGNTPTIKEEEE